MISREDVIYAYRLLLGREPESEGVVTHYASQVGSLRENDSNGLSVTAVSNTLLVQKVGP